MKSNNKSATETYFDELSAPDSTLDAHNRLVSTEYASYEINSGIFENIEKLKNLGKAAKDKLKTEMKEQIEHVSKNLKITKDAVVEAYKEPRMSNILHATGYSMATLYGAFVQANHAAHDGVLTVLTHIGAHEGLHKVAHKVGHHENVKKVDAVLEKYPVVKKLSGPAIAGLLLYGYCLAPTNKLQDWDLSNVSKALKGDFSAKDLITSSECVSLTASVASGHAFNIATIVDSVGTLTVALACNAIIHSKNPKLAELGKKIQATFDQFRSKKSPMEDIQQSKDFKGTKESMGIDPVAKPVEKENKEQQPEKKAEPKTGGDWFHRMSKEKQQDYLKKHPNSVFHKSEKDDSKKKHARLNASSRLKAYFDPEVLRKGQHVEYKSRSQVIKMDIKDFLKMAKPLSTPQKEKMDRIQHLLKHKIDFESIPFLYFEVEGDKARVTGHEGRHRAIALMELGQTTIPVELRGPIRWSEQNDPNRFDYLETWPKTLISEDGSKKIPFPVSRKESGHGLHIH